MESTFFKVKNVLFSQLEHSEGSDSSSIKRQSKIFELVSDHSLPPLYPGLSKERFEQYCTWLVNSEIRQDAVLTNMLNYA